MRSEPCADFRSRRRVSQSIHRACNPTQCSKGASLLGRLGGETYLRTTGELAEPRRSSRAASSTTLTALCMQSSRVTSTCPKVCVLFSCLLLSSHSVKGERFMSKVARHASIADPELVSSPILSPTDRWTPVILRLN